MCCLACVLMCVLTYYVKHENDRIACLSKRVEPFYKALLDDPYYRQYIAQ